jgi:hypothetical protein
MASKYFGDQRAKHSHLVKPRSGLSGEIFDLRRDIEVAFSRVQLDAIAAGQTLKSWGFQTNAAAAEYAGGFYDFASTDDDFSPSVNFGTANKSVAAHFMIVTGAVTVDEVTIRVTGTSINDDGVRTPSDSQDIIIPSGTPVDSFFETPKKWNGQVTVETISGTPVTCNYGYNKYWDFNNQNYTIMGLEALWSSDSSDSSSDIELLHQKSTGWTFNSGAEPTPPTPIAARSTDHGADNEHQVGQGAWKRANLTQVINGADSEGILFRVTSGNAGIGTLSFRQLNLEVTVCPELPSV